MNSLDPVSCLLQSRYHQPPRLGLPPDQTSDPRSPEGVDSFHWSVQPQLFGDCVSNMRRTHMRQNT